MGGAHTEVLLATTDEIPGYQVVEYFGIVMGVIALTRNVISQLGSGVVASTVGGEVGGQTKALELGRTQAIDRARVNAHAAGANAIVGLRFDSDDGTFYTAYGTAVTVVKYPA